MNSDIKRCPSCNAEELSHVEQHARYEMCRCQSCSLEFAWPMRAMSAVEYATDVDYDVFRALGESSPETVLWWGHREFIRRFHGAQSDGQHKKLLDIGCGTGAFVSYSLSHGYDAYGLDFDTASLSVAWKNPELKKRVFHGNAQAMKSSLPDFKFDVVTLFEVLEHVDDIHSFMRQIQELLSPGGIIVIYVPLGNRWSLRFNKREPADYPPNHLTRWTVKSLRVLLGRFGFSVLKEVESPVSLGLYRFISGLASQSGSVAGASPKGTPLSNGRNSRLDAVFNYAVIAKQFILSPILSFCGVAGDRILVVAKLKA